MSQVRLEDAGKAAPADLATPNKSDGSPEVGAELVAARLGGDGHPAPTASAKPGRWDDLDDDIEFLIREEDDFIVYLDTDWNVEWQTSDDYAPDSKLVGEAQNRRATVEALPLDRLAPDLFKSIKKMLAEATARALEGNEPGTREMFARCERFARARLRELARLWYLGGATAGAVIMAVLGWLGAWALAWFLGLAPQLRDELGIGVVAGALGATLSVMLRFATSGPDPEASRATHLIDGLLRAVVGGVSAAVVTLALHARVLNPELQGRSIHALLCLAGGFGERWVPNLIERVQALPPAKAEERPGGEARKQLPER